MKIRIIVACIAAALVITFVSCGLFGSKKKETAFNIEGEWTVDSIESKSNDSTKNLAIFLFAMNNDSLPFVMNFASDSSFQLISAKDTVNGNYYLSDDKNSLFIKEDSVYTQLNFVTKTDAAFTAFTADSIIYHLSKK